MHACYTLHNPRFKLWRCDVLCYHQFRRKNLVCCVFQATHESWHIIWDINWYKGHPQSSHQHILSCFQNHSCVDQCSFLQNTVHVQAFVKMHTCKVGNFTLFLQLFRILQFDQTSWVCFCRRLPSLPSSKGALQLPFLQPFKGTTNLKKAQIGHFTYFTHCASRCFVTQTLNMFLSEFMPLFVLPSCRFLR